MNGEEGVEASAKTVDEAIDKGLQQLGLERHQVRIEIITAGRPGLFGLGGEDARVRVIPMAPPSAEEMPLTLEEEEGGVVVRGVQAPEVEMAADYLREVLALLGIDVEVSLRPVETPGDGLGRASAVLDVSGDDLGILIGRRGATLAALQYMVNLIVNRKLRAKVLVSVDVEHYKRRRENSLRGLALRMAERVKQTGRSVTLEPMPAAERRIVHLALANDPAIITSSVGDGEARKVAIALRRRPAVGGASYGSPGRPPAGR